jgi:hypothetical protein
VYFRKSYTSYSRGRLANDTQKAVAESLDQPDKPFDSGPSAPDGPNADKHVSVESLAPSPRGTGLAYERHGAGKRGINHGMQNIASR